MNLEQIENRLALIKQYADAGDYEDAHNAEDQLYREFVTFIAKNGFWPSNDRGLSVMAKELLKSRLILLSRDCERCLNTSF